MLRSSIDVADAPTVFASSDAEMAIIHRISSALAEPTRVVSPIDFHNSVHNAAAGYWGIGARSTRPATTLAALDGTFAAGLHESVAMIADGEGAVLLVLYDVPPPVPLYEKRPIETACGVALIFTATSTSRSLASLALEAADTESILVDPGLESIRRGNPAARALPVLSALARRQSCLIGIRTESGALLGVRVACR
jgi:Beta-ketoacyl synthase, N-terminal domain